MVELYDLQKDPAEKNNIAAKYPAIVQQIEKINWRHHEAAKNEHQRGEVAVKRSKQTKEGHRDEQEHGGSPGQDERRRPALIAGQLAQPLDQAAQHRAGAMRVGGEASFAYGRGLLAQRGQHAVLRPEVQVGQDHVADVGHDDAPFPVPGLALRAACRTVRSPPDLSPDSSTFAGQARGVLSPGVGLCREHARCPLS